MKSKKLDMEGVCGETYLRVALFMLFSQRRRGNCASLSHSGVVLRISASLPTLRLEGSYRSHGVASAIREATFVFSCEAPTFDHIIPTTRLQER